ncbi:proline iminopeptidase-family hydrolase [Paenisporosarcina sp. TG20]|uniref:proline iminopeptidase-family hydrolase n=1 Tax=Paenisporosarcina sp. TG20 TaxID=1211706 RepID=UPI0002E0C773|nr:proline iminopeptidase-family hydrolase [Paenisporosarcina sp. TG20]
MKKDTEGYIPVTGGNVYYRMTGNGLGIPLLVLHGGPGGMSRESDPLRMLGDDRPVIYYDQLGCGNSDRPDDLSLWTVERYVEELEQVRQALGLEEVHILGHSWGTMLAAAYLLKQPSGVKSVIFSSSCLNARMWERDQRNYLKELPQETQEIIELSEQQNTTDSDAYQDAMIQFYERHVCRTLPWPQELLDNMKKTNHTIYGYMWGASEFTVTGTLQDFDVTNRLNEIKIPSLFTCGRFDEATPKTTEYYASLVSESELYVFENSSHMPGVEEPQAYADKIRDFVNRQY